ncbi:hypothetical protein CRENBAI_016393 [Crenichthys baileyi]|uniref:Uncharacterized protein n=1 Tax=Crenichthys baileyi TaxID=28760 RepID=A0AAV9QZB6_9TELE
MARKTNTPTEDNNTASSSHAGSGVDAIGTEAKPSEEFTQNDEVLPEPKTGAASISAVSQETNTAAPSCSVDSDTKSHVISQPPSSGSVPTEPGHVQEKPDHVSSDKKPEVGSAAEAKDSLKSDQEENTNPEGSSPAGDIVEETGKNAPEEKKDDSGKKQEKEEAALTVTEAPQVEKQTDIQEKPAVEEHSCIKAMDKPAAEEEGAQDDRRGAQGGAKTPRPQRPPCSRGWAPEGTISPWQAAADCPGAAERQNLCERLFQGEEEELGMLEALKLLMLGRASELHDCMQVGEDVPLFCWLLFARDSSGCPRSFLSNHLRHVGLSAGLEQVEMFLLGYALQHTIQVYRLYKADTEEFVTFYPDDHRDDWPSVCLVTEDDRHYNVPVTEAAEPSEEFTSS